MSGPTNPIGEDDLQAAVDGRLPPGRRDAVDAFLAGHPAVSARVEADRTIRRALREVLRDGSSEPVPSRLRIGAIRAARARARRRIAARALAASFLLAAGVGSGWLLRGFVAPPGHPGGDWGAIASDAAAAFRTYSVESLHPVEVRADQEPHLVQWLSRRLGRPLVVPDLAALGFSLVGGRLLPASPGLAALIMFADREGRRLTLYVRSAGVEGGREPHVLRDEAGTWSCAWSSGGTGYVVSAALGRDRVLDVARAVAGELGEPLGSSW